MKMRNYMKRKGKYDIMLLPKRLFSCILKFIVVYKKPVIGFISLMLILPIAATAFVNRDINETITGDFANNIQLAAGPVAASSSQRSVIAIPSGMVKANPFVPYRDIEGTSTINDVPAYTLIEPPETANENSDAARVMDTIVSGILFDKFSPSAILNIEGNDYLVKKGDVVNNYKVIAIAQDSVTVQLGNNVYKAGIGEILTEGTLHRNDVANLNNKFGGVK